MRIAALIICIELFITPVLQAQASNPLGGFFNRVKDFFTELQLTEDQQNRVREVFMGDAVTLVPLMQDQSLSREEKTRKLQEWGDQLDGKLKPILTTEQFQKYKVKKEEWQKGGLPGGAARSDRIKTALQCSDEEWKAIQPLIEDVMKKQRERAARTGVQEIQDLQKALDEPGVPAGTIRRRMEALRAYQREKESALKAARDRLRQVLIARQEAILLLYGILD